MDLAQGTQTVFGFPMPYDMKMTLTDRSVRLCLLCALALATACGDDAVATTDAGSTSDDGSTTATTNPSTAGTSSTTGSADNTTEAADSSTTGDLTSTTGPGAESSTTDAGTSSSTGDASSSSSSSSTTGTMEMMECPYGQLMAPDVLSTSTAGQDSEFTNSCGGGGAPDVSYTLIAPADGTYYFTATSPNGVVDPLVAVYDGTCGGPELACNEDIDGGTTAAEVSVALTEGQDVTVVLDGFSLAGGTIDLEVTFFAGACPDGDLGNTVPAVATGTTVGADNTVFSSCGGNTANDDQLTFTAPQDGVYTFDTAGSDFDTLLYVLDGCGGDELGCSDDVLATETSHLNLLMTADQEVNVVVDGANLEEGNYTVTVERDECPDFVLDNTLPVSFSGSTAGELDASTGSCGGAGAPGTSFSFTAPEAGVYTIDTLGSAFDTVLYTIDSCGGPDLACNNDAGVDATSRLNVTLAENDEIFFVVDGANGQSGDFDVNIAFDECPDFDLGQDLPITVVGNTLFETNASSGSCGPGASNDVAYTFTAPVAGTYIFDTNGSDFDTVLYYFAGAACAGTQIECDDDDGDGLDSLLFVPLEADEQITMIVDGRFGGGGDYVLNVTLPQCGNDFIELGEECEDGLIQETCFSQGLGGGTLSCDATCQFDTSACGDDCGNGELDAGEECDLGELGGATCMGDGFAGGPMGCGSDCNYDTAECSDDLVVVCSSPAAAIDSAFPTTTDTITIPDVGTIADVDVFLDITHTFDGDLEMTLIADDLALQNNLSFDDCGGNDDVFATYNDEGDFLAAAACIAPVGIEGNLIPEQPLSVYDGSASNGEWTLSITDDAGGDTGTLNEWCLFITLE